MKSSFKMTLINVVEITVVLVLNACKQVYSRTRIGLPKIAHEIYVADIQYGPFVPISKIKTHLTFKGSST